MKRLLKAFRFLCLAAPAAFACSANATESASFHVDTRNLTLCTNTVNGVRWVYYKTGQDATVYEFGGSACNASSATVTVPDTLGGCTVREIEYKAFEGLSLQKLILPAGITGIGRGAFSGCTSLKGVYFLGNAPTMDARAFEGSATDMTLYVREGANGWSAGGTLPSSYTTGDKTSRALRYCYRLSYSSIRNGGIRETAQDLYPAGATQVLTATPASRYLFLRWTGDLEGCTEADNVLTVRMTRDRTIGAEFTEDVYPPTLEAKSGDTRLEWNLVAGEERDSVFLVSNPYHGTQSGLKVTVIGCPASCRLTYAMPSTIAADSDVMLTFHAKALAASPSSEWETFTIRVTTAEGGTIDIPAAFHAVSERARLTTVEDTLVSTMALGEHTEVSFTLVNDTGVETGKIHLNYTSYGWLSLVGPKTLPSLGPGETRTVTFALDPAVNGDWSQSVSYDGNILYSCDEGTGGSIDFAFTPVTDKTGSVHVLCKDNSGADATYVAFQGATVSLLDAATLEEVRSGTTGADGVCDLASLPVGRYVIGVTAQDHDSYKAVIYVRAGQQTDVRALMSVAIVTGRAEFKWIEIEDEYVMVYTPQIVHVVPAPNVEWTLSPRKLAEGDTTIVQMHVKNVGLVKATSVTFAFPAYPANTHHIQFSANGFKLDPGEERDVTVRFVCDDKDCRGNGTSREGYATMKVAYTSSDPETGESKTVGYCDGKVVLHGNVPVPEYVLPELVFTVPKGSGDGTDKRTYDPDYELLNSGRVVFRSGDYESSGQVEWPKKPRPDAVVPVTLEIRQPVSLARDVIDGSFVFSNKSETAEAYIHLDIEIVNAAGEDCRHLFNIVATNTANDGSVPLDGTLLREGEVTLAALKEGRAGFWFVPTRDAAPTEAVDYYFGGSFVYHIGTGGTLQTNDLMLCKMTVSPMPYLKMDYFTQRDVFSDNPFTDITEAYQPAEFALRVRNEGGGAAKNVRISSSRPQIITNESNLVVDYDLRNWSYASYLDGTSTTLDLDTINLGTIQSGETTVAEWLFVSTLEGHFTTNGHARLEYTMPWQNSSTTQISENIGVHLLVHRCHADDDKIVDFLTSEKSTGAPDKLWCSEAEEAEDVITNAFAEVVSWDKPAGGAATLTLRVTASEPGPVYVSAPFDDGKTYRVSTVRRDYGGEVAEDNAWTTDRTFVPIDLTTAFGSRPIREGRIHLFDRFAQAGQRTYTITLEPRFVYLVGDEEGGHRVGETLTLSVATETEPKAMQRVCTAWTALCDGNEIASGETNEVSFTFTDAGAYDVNLEWMTNYWISVSNSFPGVVRSASKPAKSGWYESGSDLVLTAKPRSGYSLVGWTGDLEGCTESAEGKSLSVPVDRPRTVVPEFELKSHTVRLGDAGLCATVPAAGDFVCDYGTVVTVDVARVEHVFGVTQIVCKGWVASNASPTSGLGGHAVFAVRGDAELQWLWQTNVLTVAEAANLGTLAYACTGADWVPQWDKTANDGHHQLMSGNVANGGTATLELTFEGPGDFSFAWKSSCGADDAFTVTIDGEQKGKIAGETGWTTVEEVLDLGDHTVRFSFARAAGGSAGANAIWLDAVNWKCVPYPTLRTALCESLCWYATGTGTAKWRPMRRKSATEPRPAWAQVAGLAPGEQATLETVVYGAGSLSFDWCVRAMDDGSLKFYLDDAEQTVTAPSTGWSTATWTLSGVGGTEKHTLRWVYVKGASGDAGSDNAPLAKIDNVSWTSAPGVAMETFDTTIPVKVPFAKIRTTYSNYWERARGDFNSAVKLVGENGIPVYESYVAGLDPSDPDSQFTTEITTDENGELKVTWKPDLNEGDTRNVRTYRTKGKKSLGDRNWVYMDTVTDEAQKAEYKFFSVEVSMP